MNKFVFAITLIFVLVFIFVLSLLFFGCKEDFDSDTRKTEDGKVETPGGLSGKVLDLKTGKISPKLGGGL